MLDNLVVGLQGGIRNTGHARAHRTLWRPEGRPAIDSESHGVIDSPIDDLRTYIHFIMTCQWLLSREMQERRTRATLPLRL